MSTVVVLGAGAVGSLFGARLAASGADVTLVGRPAHLEAVRAHGLTVEGVDPGTFRLRTASRLEGLDSVESVLLTVKSFDLVPAVEALAHALPPTRTLLLGNGLGIEPAALGALRAGGWARPEAVLVRAVHTVPATLLGPGRVRASGSGEVVLPEPGLSREATPAVAYFQERLTRAGFSVRTSSAFDVEVWRKVVVNAAINPVTAVRHVLNGALRDGPARAEAEELAREAVEVARRSGVALTWETAQADLGRVLEATAENRSSMLQDVERGRPTEVDAISGELLRRGEELGLQLPATRRAVEQLRRVVAGRTGPPQR